MANLMRTCQRFTDFPLPKEDADRGIAFKRSLFAAELGVTLRDIRARSRGDDQPQVAANSVSPGVVTWISISGESINLQ